MLGLKWSQREDFHFGCKLVRGAYMDRERELARKMNYEDPIHDDWNATNVYVVITPHLKFTKFLNGLMMIFPHC